MNKVRPDLEWVWPFFRRKIYMKMLSAVFFSSSLLIMTSLPVYGFESTKVLPKGIRNVTVKSVNAAIDEKTNSQGTAEPIAQPLQKNITFKDILKKETPLKQSQIRALMLKENFQESDSLGQMNAEMKGDVSVIAPIFSYGITERLTLAIAVPYYSAHMAVDLGFESTATAQDFVNQLSTPLNNQLTSARDAGGKLNNAVGDLDDKLVANGFSPLREWEGKGVGDITLAGKYLLSDASILKFATMNGVVLPTGKVDDPNNLIDIPFGDGTLDVFASLISDQVLGLGFSINEFGKYTYQQPTIIEKRMADGDEKIEVETRNVAYKLGDKIDAGSSFQYEPQFGLVAAVGYSYFKKFGDHFDGPSASIRETLSGNSAQESTHFEGKLGYSGVPAFQRGSIPVPFSTTIEYKKHIASKNMPTSDLVTLETAVFF
jgi:hypothetical protein